MDSTVDGEDAPPPYTPIDPLNLAAAATNNPTIDAAVPTRGVSSNTPPPNFISAAPFFRERSLPNIPRGHHEPLKHTLNVYKRSQAKDYTRFPRCWRSDSGEITQHDWDTFLGYLLPPHLGPSPGKGHGRADHPKESGEERRIRIASVAEEWNSCFFTPRNVMVVCNYIQGNGTSSVSPLCPRCYPTAAGSISLRNASSAPGYTAPTNPENHQATFTDDHSPLNHAGDGGAASLQERDQGFSQVGPQIENGRGSWMWNANNRIQNWATQLSEQAAVYGKRANEQAQYYGAMAQQNAQAHADYAQRQAKYAENIARWPHARSSPWGNPRGFGAGRGGGGRGGGGGGWMGGPLHGGRAHWDHVQHQQGEGRRGIGPEQRFSLRRRDSSASISSFSSISSSSSSSSDDSLSSLDLAKVNANRSEVTALRTKINNLREEKLKDVRTSSDSRLAAEDDCHGLRSAILARRNLHTVSHGRRGRCQSDWCGPEMSKAEAKAAKKELRTMKQEYRDLANRFRQEKRDMRRRNRERRREEEKKRKEERKEMKKISKARKKGNGELQILSMDLQCSS